MPTYTYFCNDCKRKFELFFYIKEYNSQPSCDYCKKKNTNRMYIDDVITQSASVKKADTELRTIGDLAQRNNDRMSDDEKIHLYNKHNSYKYTEEEKQLPSGMSRIKKPPKTIWPGSKPKRKRKSNGR
jgi:putative FmdB family regulatory protein